MEILIGLIFLWGVVIVVGHGSFVMLRYLFKGVGKQQPAEKFTMLPNAGSDGAAARRVIDRLVRRELLTEPAADELREKIAGLAQDPFSVPVTSLASQPQLSRPPVSGSDDRPESESVPILAELAHESDAHDSDFHEPVRPDTKVLPDTVLPVAATAVEDKVPGEPPARVLSPAEVIRSFLDARNIRWGELVAGMLIVICSIGLVISLWHPLVETHRVIPSLIFLSANAAIYGAGLYTLSRWRLRHTSRAVLLIATLLVPLSVLAGLAAAGQGADAVLLNDPITLGAIGIAGVVYCLLLHRGGRALVRRFYANPMTLVVAGPAVVMPFVPAAIRTLDVNAGWITGIGSLAIFIASAIVLRRRPDNRSIGVAVGKATLQLMAVAGFASLMSIGYASFALREFGRDAIVPIAIATIPTLLGLASLARSLQTRSRSGTQAMIGAVLCTLLFAVAWTVLPVASLSANWLWLWGATFSLTAGAAAIVFRQPRWLAIATLPIGTTATLTSPVWLAGNNWTDVGFWNRVLAGEPMLAMTGFGLLVGAVFGWMRWREPGYSIPTKWMGFAAAFWGGAAIVTASILSIAPEELLGAVPWWTATGLLALVALVCWAVSTRVGTAVYGAIIATVFGWVSVFRPVTLNWFLPGEVIDGAEPAIWMWALVAIAATLVGLSELLRYIGPALAAPPKVTRRSDFALMSASAIAAVTAAVVACGFASNNWNVSAVTLGISSTLLLWSSIRTRMLQLCMASQLTTVALGVVLGCGYFGDSLIGWTAWQDGRALWGWSIIGSTVVLIWLGLGQLANRPEFGIQHRAHHLAELAKSPWRWPHGWVGVFSAASIAAGTGWTIVQLLGQVLADVAGIDAVIGTTGFVLPVFAFVAAAVSTIWMNRQEVDPPKVKFAGWLPAGVGVASMMWLGVYAATSLDLSPQAQLIVATSLSAVGLALLYQGIPRTHVLFSDETKSVSLFTGVAFLGLSSAALLLSGWIYPIQIGQPVDRASTLAVTAWWVIAGVTSLWICKTRRDTGFGFVSALLLPVAAVVAYPLFEAPSVPVGFQVAAIAAFVWRAVAWWWLRDDEESLAGSAIQGAVGLLTVVGVGSALAAIGRFAISAQFLSPILGFASCLVSLIAIAYWCSVGLPSRPRNVRISWQMGLSLFAGQMAWLAFAIGLVAPNQIILATQILAGVWVVASIGSLFTRRIDGVALGHLGFLAVAITFIDNAVGSQLVLLPWFALTAWSSVGVAIVRVGADQQAGRAMRASANLLGWLVVGVGAYLLVNRIGSIAVDEVALTVILIWSAFWVLVWRLVNPDRDDSPLPIPSATPDFAWAFLIVGAVLVDTAGLIFDELWGNTGALRDPLLWTRVGMYCLVGLSTVTRASRPIVWALSCTKLVSVVAIISVAVAIQFDATASQRACSAIVAAGFAIALMSHWLVPLTASIKRIRADITTAILPRVVESVGYVAMAIAGVGGLFSIGMMIDRAPAADIRLTIVSVGLSAWAVTVIANSLQRSYLRHVAVFIGLFAIGLLASVETAATPHPTLGLSMRWLVASVVTIPFTLFMIPALFGDRMTIDWRVPLRRGAMFAATTGVSSLAVMLVREAMLHTPDGIPGISSPMVIGVAVTLSILSGLAGLIAILSEPTSKWRDRLALSDRQRIVLIVAAQAIGGITWLHVFLCKTHWAFAGLRGYWPYIVMALAFVSVGATEWAQRRRDAVLSNTLRKTALYLPLIPIIGFWFGGVEAFDWLFHRGKVRYDLMLAISAAYYIGISALWKGVMPRIAAVILGNAAWWVVLVQSPGWGFLSHPQLWTIPPAACLLVIAHLYRDRLDPSVATAVRYGSTLVIYISSTADMLLSQIGQNLWGPVILVLLALAGMAAGVVLRVRPFLYLGAIFVFAGVTSMVWHAQRSIGEVWPWWVFGITTGVCLLAGLMAIEKNKPKLRQYANELATWQ